MGMRYCSAKFEKSSKCKVRVMLQLPHVKFRTAMRQTLCSSRGISLHLFQPVASWSNLNTVISKKCDSLPVLQNVQHKTVTDKHKHVGWCFLWPELPTRETIAGKKSPYCISVCLWLLCRHVACALRGWGAGMHSGSGVRQPCAHALL